MAPCAPRAAAASGVRTLGSVVRRAGVVWSRRTVHFGAVSPHA